MRTESKSLPMNILAFRQFFENIFLRFFGASFEDIYFFYVYFYLLATFFKSLNIFVDAFGSNKSLESMEAAPKNNGALGGSSCTTRGRHAKWCTLPCRGHILSPISHQNIILDVRSTKVKLCRLYCVSCC